MTPLRNPLLVMKLLGLFLALSLPATAVSQDRAVLLSHPVQKGSGVESPDGLQNPSPAPPKAYQRPSSVQATPIAQLQQADFGGASTFSVTNTNDSGSGSLRQAIRDANASSGADIINFSIPGGGVHTITPDSALPALTGPVVIDGTTQAGYAGYPLIEIDGSHAGTGVNGLVLRGGSSTIRGLAVNSFVNSGIYDGHGIVLETLGGNTLQGNYIGTDPTGLSARPNGGSGVVIAGSSSRNKIGLPSASASNILSGNSGAGLQISSGSGGRNLIQGNFIGVDVTGTLALPNGGNGVFVDAQYDTIGGTTTGEGNLVSGNTLPGLYLGSSARWTVIQANYLGTALAGDAALGNTSNGIMVDSAASTTIRNNLISGNLSTGLYVRGTPATGNVILGNHIGTNLSGTASLGNSSHGIVIDNAPANAIGSPSHGNLISGNGGVGVWISGANASANTIEGNLIGVNLLGTDSIPNRNIGIFIQNAPLNAIGGPAVDSRNVISGNRTAGICIMGAGASANTVTWSMIGSDQSGYAAVSNKGNGILIDGAPNSTIGAAGYGANVISGNTQTGIAVVNQGASGNRIIGNYIGIDASGAAALPNGAGVLINNAPGNTIGGSLSEEGNTISGNAYYGIGIRNPQATGNSVRGNYIGTSTDGAVALGNGLHGVLLIAPQNSIGGTDQSDGNKIAHNGGAGVYDSLGGGNLIRMNSIFDNGELGIDIYPRGWSLNDRLDTDGRQNFPLLDSVVIAGANTTIHGRLQSYANGTFTLDFFLNMDYDPSHFGEGSYYFGSGTVTTDDLGLAEINVQIPVAAPTNRYITATATDAAGNTSEFSQCFCLSDLDGDGILDSWETEGWGMDLNSDGKCELDLHAMGATPDHKDVFVEVDAMDFGVTGFTLGPNDPLQDVVSVFSAVPNNFVNNPDGQPGIRLHVVYQDDKFIPRATWYTDTWEQFFNARRQYFGTKAERSSPDSANILTAKGLVFRYCIFADDHHAKHYAGWSNGFISNNFMVTLGSVDGGTEMQKAATFMHELGHALGLHHGGGDDINYKPNYISVMNYTWQDPHWDKLPPGTWALRYSTSALPALDESHLNEQAGLSPAVGTYRNMAVPFRDGKDGVHWARLIPGTGVDWDGNLDSTSAASADVSADISHLDLSEAGSAGQTLRGFEDWSHLVYNFRNSPTFSTGEARGVPIEPDMPDEVRAMLRNLPPPKPYGRFTMDGLLDTTAVLLGSNGGVNLYAAVRGGQLYVATNSATSQGADMVIFVAVPPGAVRHSPLGKGGQVAGWSAFLFNRSSDNSRGWYDSSGVPLTCITLDTVGTMLEGVVDFQLLTGECPESLYVAVGKYASEDGGTLLTQVPAGNGDGNIDPEEFTPLSTPSPFSMHWRQQGERLVASGSNPNAEFGNAVAISADGNTAVVVALRDNVNRSAVYVFARSNGAWSQQGSKLLPANTGYQWVKSVSISADGNTFIAGADDLGTGGVWVFTRSNGVWSKQDDKLVGTGIDNPLNGYCYQGCSVSISGDGNMALVGGYGDNYGAGAVWTFVRTNGQWRQQGGRLVGTGAIGRAQQGYCVVLSSDGSTALVGGPNDNGYRGAFWVFRRVDSTWVQEAKIPSPYPEVSAVFGTSAALSANGTTAVFGSPYGGSDQSGRAQIFIRTNGTWNQEGPTLWGFDAVKGSPEAHLGYSVAISGDGNIAVAGGPNDNSSAGAVWTYVRRDGLWSQDGGKLFGTGEIANAHQGYSVALSSDGTTLITGGMWNSLPGAAWIFVKPVGTAFSISSFGAQHLPAVGVRLDWTAVSGVASYGFTVQRRSDQQSEFIDIPNGSVAGFAPPGVSQAYSYVDTSVHSGTWVYRIRAMDVNGTAIYTDAIAVDVVSGVEENLLPRAFSLEQNYPNPWNPSTVIRYTVPHRVHVSITVYNTLGQRVAQIVDAQQDAGFYNVLFRANGLGSGVYFYQMRAGDFVMTKKFLLLK